MERSCLTCTIRDRCDTKVYLNGSKIPVPDPKLCTDECIYYSPDMTVLALAGARQAAVDRIAEIAMEGYSDHRTAQVYVTIRHAKVPVMSNPCEGCMDRANEIESQSVPDCDGCEYYVRDDDDDDTDDDNPSYVCELDECVHSDDSDDSVCGRCDKEPVKTGEEDGEYTVFVINVLTDNKLSDREGMVREQEIRQKLQDMNDEELQMENCVFELSFVYVEEG